MVRFLLMPVAERKGLLVIHGQNASAVPDPARRSAVTRPQTEMRIVFDLKPDPLFFNCAMQQGGELQANAPTPPPVTRFRWMTNPLRGDRRAESSAAP